METAPEDGTQAQIADASCFYTAKVEEPASCTDEVALKETETVGADGASSCRRSEYYSVRCESMMQSKSKFIDEIEQEIEFSKPHWSEVRRPEAFTEEEERQNRENKEVFEELKNDFEGMFFGADWNQFFEAYWNQFFWADEFSMKMGRMIAKGGQAEIYELHEQKNLLLKVFERGSLLQLRKLWPLQVLKRQVKQCILGGIMLEDGRFAFVMERCWGDLRKMIDKAMQAKNIDGIPRPPFPYEWERVTIIHAEGMMWEVAEEMKKLHENGIFHRDLKASNILLWYRDHVNKVYRMYEMESYGTTSLNASGSVIIADFECSIGVVGTGFWRAPEILSALEKGEVIKEEQWEKADVYSYGMTCFEIVTGRLPFEGELENTRAGRALVINGHRPKLPNDLDERLKGLITRCWDQDTSLRPSFSEITKELYEIRRCHLRQFRLFGIEDELPGQYRLATKEDVSRNRYELNRDVMRGWEIANLADGSVHGHLYGCETSSMKKNNVGHKLATFVGDDNIAI